MTTSFRLHILFMETPPITKPQISYIILLIVEQKCQKTFLWLKPPLYSIQIQYTKHLINKKIFFFLLHLMAFIGQRFLLGYDISSYAIEGLSYVYIGGYRFDRCHIVIDTYWLVNIVVQYDDFNIYLI